MGKFTKPKIPKFLKSVKYILAAVNGAFVLTGLLLLAAGVIVLVIYSEYEELITQRFFNVTGFSTATGVIILLVSGLGFYAAVSEHFYFVAGYVVLMVMVIVFEVALVISSFALYNDGPSDIRPTMHTSLQQYGTRVEVAKLWDDMQREFGCCGVVGRFDYASHLIPVSCCYIDIGAISPFECQTTNSHNIGCAAALGEWLAYNAYVIAICALVSLSIQENMPNKYIPVFRMAEIILAAMSGWMAWRTKFEEVELES